MVTITKSHVTLAQLGNEVPLSEEHSLTAVCKWGTWQYCLVQHEQDRSSWVVAVRFTDGDEKEVARLFALSDETAAEEI